MNLFVETAEMRARRTAAGEGGSSAALWQPSAPEADSQQQQANREHEAARRERVVAREDAPDEVRPDGSYSLEQESYQTELAFDRARTRRRKLAAVVRTIAAIVLVPAVLAVVFLASYTLTCILNGATRQEVVELLGDLAHNVIELIQSIV